MTLTEAYRVLRRFEDWHVGKDLRTIEVAIPKKEYHEAIRLILASQGLDSPIADCRSCRHRGSIGIACGLLVQGECTKFEEVQP